MPLGIDPATIRFATPEYLWLLAAPGLMLLGWVCRAVIWRRDIQRVARRHRAPVRQRFAPLGGLASWLCVIGAVALTLLAAARPQATVTLVRRSGIDVIVLQDGSSSMHIRDVDPDRWQRSMRFLRILAESLQWSGRDRMAIAVFAHVAAPQVRLTTDPNTVFYFLDHLSRQSPFPLEDDTSWDTNIERGLQWGLRLVEKDEERSGRSPNTQVFVLVSDGQAWGGEIARAATRAAARNIPIFAVGVGTPTGGDVPEAPLSNAAPRPAATSGIRGRLDRESLRSIAAVGGGSYLELDRQGDHEIAATIVDASRRRSGPATTDAVVDELYTVCLWGAACLVALATLLLRDVSELWLIASAAAAALALLWPLIA